MHSIVIDCVDLLRLKRPVITRVLRDCTPALRRCPEPEEVWGHLAEVIERRFPSRIAEGDAPGALVDRTIRAETLKFAIRELSPRGGPAGRPSISLDAEGPPEPAGADDVLGMLVDREEIERLRSAIDRLPAKDRDLIRGYYGIDREERSLAAIAAQMGITPQAAGRRRKLAIDRLRIALTCRHAS